MFSDFTTTTYGKWILAGEHAVLRDHPALVFPLQQKSLTLEYTHQQTALTAEYHGSHADKIQWLFWSVLEHGLHGLHYALNQINGHFRITCNIPIGEGMGASAALCVAVARWFAHQQIIAAASIQDCAHTLEHLFHGKSSGLDIVGVSSTHGNYFTRTAIKNVIPAWHPCWYLSSSGALGITAHCIARVQSLWDKNPELGQSLDVCMHQAVDKAYHALTGTIDRPLPALAEAIQLAESCFRGWGLVDDALNDHIKTCYAQGALAAKPTGSGAGGYVLSLWETPPPHAHMMLCL